MTQVKTKFDANTSASKIIRNFRRLVKLFRREVIWIQCFHWPNITTCGKYLCRFHLLQRKRKHKRKNEKKENFDPCTCACACAYARVKAVFTVGEIRIIVLALVLALVLASPVKPSLKYQLVFV